MKEHSIIIIVWCTSCLKNILRTFRMKVLFCAVIGLGLVMMCLKGFSGPWYRYMFRFVLLFSYIIPISLRVNLDMGKTFYAWCIQRDKDIAGTVVRTTTIPEELGRISYLLSDKTGTLTQNKMVFKKLHLGTVSYGQDSFDEINSTLTTYYSSSSETTPAREAASSHSGKVRRSEITRIYDAVHALALCHNVTPVFDETTVTAVDNRRLDTDSIETVETVSSQRYFGCLFSSINNGFAFFPLFFFICKYAGVIRPIHTIIYIKLFLLNLH